MPNYDGFIAGYAVTRVGREAIYRWLTDNNYHSIDIETAGVVNGVPVVKFIMPAEYPVEGIMANYVAAVSHLDPAVLTF